MEAFRLSAGLRVDSARGQRSLFDMRDIRTKIASTAIAAALIFSPTAAVASTYSPTASSDAWVTLSTLTPAGATALAGSGAAAPSAATLAAAQSTVAYDEPR